MLTKKRRPQLFATAWFVAVLVTQQQDIEKKEYHFELWAENAKSTKTSDISVGLLVVIENPGKNLHQKFGTVCADAFNIHAADIVCSQLGFKMAAGIKSIKDVLDSPTIEVPRLGKLNDVRILYENVTCQIYSGSWNYCEVQDSLGECSHEQDAVVECINEDNFDSRQVELSLWGTDETERDSAGVLAGTVPLINTKLFHDVNGTILWDFTQDYRESRFCDAVGQAGFEYAVPTRGQWEEGNTLRVLTRAVNGSVTCDGLQCILTQSFAELFSRKLDHYYDMILSCQPAKRTWTDEAHICVGKSEPLQCPGGKLAVLSAEFGAPSYYSGCYASETEPPQICGVDRMATVSENCDGYSMCVVYAKNDSVACPHVENKFLEVRYACEIEAETIVQFHLKDVFDLIKDKLAFPDILKEFIHAGLLSVTVTNIRDDNYKWGGIVCGNFSNVEQGQLEATVDAACKEMGYWSNAFYTEEYIHTNEVNVTLEINQDKSFSVYNISTCEEVMKVICFSRYPEHISNTFRWKLENRIPGKSNSNNEGTLMLEHKKSGDTFAPLLEFSQTSNEELKVEQLKQYQIDKAFCRSFGFRQASDDGISFVTDETITSCIPIMFPTEDDVFPFSFDAGRFMLNSDKVNNDMLRCQNQKFMNLKCERKDTTEFDTDAIFDLFLLTNVGPTLNNNDLRMGPIPMFAVVQNLINYNASNRINTVLSSGLVCEMELSVETLNKICIKNNFHGLLAHGTAGKDASGAYKIFGDISSTPTVSGNLSCSPYFAQLVTCIDTRYRDIVYEEDASEESYIILRKKDLSEVFATYEDSAAIYRNWSLTTFILYSHLPPLGEGTPIEVMFCSGNMTNTAYFNLVCPHQTGSVSRIDTFEGTAGWDIFDRPASNILDYSSAAYIIRAECTDSSHCNYISGPPCKIGELLVVKCNGSAPDGTEKILFSLLNNKDTWYRNVPYHGRLIASVTDQTTGMEQINGTVCDDNWSSNVGNAFVICQELGFYFPFPGGTEWSNVGHGGTHGVGSTSAWQTNSPLTEQSRFQSNSTRSPSIESPRTELPRYRSDSTRAPSIESPRTEQQRYRSDSTHRTFASSEPVTEPQDFPDRIIMDSVRCREFSEGILPGFLRKCSYETNHDCSHYEDVYLICSGYRFLLTDETLQNETSKVGYIQAIVINGTQVKKTLVVALSSIFEADVACSILGHTMAFSYRNVSVDGHQTSFPDFQLDGYFVFRECTTYSSCRAEYILTDVNVLYELECSSTGETEISLTLVDQAGKTVAYNGLVVSKESNENVRAICASYDALEIEMGNFLCNNMGLGATDPRNSRAIDISSKNDYSDITNNLMANEHFEMRWNREYNIGRFRPRNTSDCQYVYILACLPEGYSVKGLTLLSTLAQEVDNNGILHSITGKATDDIISYTPICSASVLTVDNFLNKICEWFGFYTHTNHFEEVSEGLDEIEIWADIEFDGENDPMVYHTLDCSSNTALQITCGDPDLRFHLQSKDSNHSNILGFDSVGYTDSHVCTEGEPSDMFLNTACKLLGSTRGYLNYTLTTVENGAFVLQKCSEVTEKQRCGFLVNSLPSNTSCIGIQLNCRTDATNITFNKMYELVEKWYIRMELIFEYRILKQNSSTQKESGSVMLENDSDTATFLCEMNAKTFLNNSLIDARVVYSSETEIRVIAYSFHCPRESETLDECSFITAEEKGASNQYARMYLLCAVKYYELHLDYNSMPTHPSIENSGTVTIKLFSNHDFQGNFVEGLEEFFIGGHDPGSVYTYAQDHLHILGKICKLKGYSNTVSDISARNAYVSTENFCSTTLECPYDDDQFDLNACRTRFVPCPEDSFYTFGFQCHQELRELDVQFSLKNNLIEAQEFYGILYGQFEDPNEGILKSGTVCGLKFDLTLAGIICLKMGYDRAVGFELNEDYVHFTDTSLLRETDISIENVQSQHNEFYDYELIYIVKEPKNSNCTHENDIILRCDNNDQHANLRFNLRAGENIAENMNTAKAGILIASLEWETEIGIKNRMGLVCDDGFSYETANAVCLSMGFHKATLFSNNVDEPFLSNIQLSETYFIVIDDLTCTSADGQFRCDKSHKVHDCKVEEAVNLWCEYDPALCTDTNLNGYLKTTCPHPSLPEFTAYKCPASDQYYRILYNSCSRTTYSDLCENDPAFYQACGHRPPDCSGSTTFISNEILCGSFVCVNSEVESGDAVSQETRCNMVDDCKNTDADEGHCDTDDKDDEVYCYGIEKQKLSQPDMCDNKCDCAWCDDERNCSSVQYGTLCQHPYVTANSYTELHGSVIPMDRYVPPYWICDGIYDCFGGEDEEGCSGEVEDLDKSPHVCMRENKMIHLIDSNKCAVENELEPFGSVCPMDGDEFKSQLNCADPQLRVLICMRQGYSVTISSRYVCTEQSQTTHSLCTNKIDKSCDEPEPKCTIHKHQNCDGRRDCLKTGADEDRLLCQQMTQTFKCIRAYIGNGEVERSIPYSWVLDGEQDCLDGSDEMESMFPATCGQGSEMRRVEIDKDCADQDLTLFKCFTTGRYIDLSYVCDRIESCGNENKICEVSRKVAVVHSNVMEDRYSAKHLSYCLPGLKDLAFLKGGCKEDEFKHPFPMVGVLQETIHHPSPPPDSNESIDCGSVFGELYVYLSCSGLCSDDSVVCPLGKLGDSTKSCSNLPDAAKTMAVSSSLRFTSLAITRMVKGEVTYRNNVFRCNNDLCVDYSKVCNLVNDCGDESDEEECSNHFRCANGDYIPSTSKCDGQSDCIDLSDECNTECKKDIVDQNHGYLIVVSWVIGILAVFANSVIIVKSVYEFVVKTHSAAALMNKLLIFFISLGDFLMGLYLVIIAAITTSYSFHEDNLSYCKQEFEWLTSWECAGLGVMSSFGSQISLYSMTVLSISRLLGIRSVFAPMHLTVKIRLKFTALVLFILSLSTFIAFLPLLDIFEDFFVNGLYYPNNPLFIGAPNILSHLQILGEYFGVKNWPDSWANWDDIRGLVREMFSSYSNVVGKKQHFYGNDGVCLFKFFVNSDDPQAEFIWAVLGFNFVCFVVITLSYVIIHFFSAQSSKNLSCNAGNKAIQKRNQKLQRKISMIILTDFCCWIPLILICVLHFTKVMELSSLYPFFSTLILPINSVINPLLYDTTVGDLVWKVVFMIKNCLFGEEARPITQNSIIGNRSMVESIPLELLSVGASEPSPTSLQKIKNTLGGCVRAIRTRLEGFVEHESTERDEEISGTSTGPPIHHTRRESTKSVAFSNTVTIVGENVYSDPE